MIQRKTGYIPDPQNAADWNHATLMASRPLAAPRVENLDMLRLVPDILDQLSIGSCVANATLGAVRLKNKLDGINDPELGSRLLTYYLARGYIGTTDHDSGSHIRDAFKSLNQYGFCRESAYPYQVGQFAEKPPAHLFTRSFDQRSPARYWRISSYGTQRIAELKAAIDAGNPIVCGAMLGQSFMGWEGTIGEKCPLIVGAPVGGHAFYAVAYNEVGLICVNSWGRDWGDLGRFTVSWNSKSQGCVDDLLDVWVVENAPYFSDEPRDAA